jgi:L-ascorbate metabolism protein UlaG (beta-lactamase superfamily)
MHITHVRYATSVNDYAGYRFLTDPVLAPAEPDADPLQRKPLVPVPVSTLPLIASIDAVLVSHIHPDSFDQAAAEVLDKSLPVFAQPQDLPQPTAWGFAQVPIVEESTRFGDITITRTIAEHGHGEARTTFGPASGWVLQAEGEPTLYIAGDTVWAEPVRETIDTFAPDVIVLYGGAAHAKGMGPITMTAVDIGIVRQHAPDAEVIVVHVDAFPHTTESRAEIDNWLGAHGLRERVILPRDGESVAIPARDHAISRR